ncbi:protoporphyrinogen oxidase [Paenibacillus mucilaginosus 3016]|uniref:Coproporphyrinogen III oxidase n=1 Tax=Paenibacillus mucilaginosus 3016 TaxID=1116391 RepID=H6NDN2_9BACL|nr:protoporphyrinogen oxidase [Paenibacillus mucilaginosus]AFC31372.1 protoporphyrinogen oxidase [Paenibacillus mucilaginosus 3016]WFA19928.1 protoporphyrinogen oxidase [Paenibacillus mucilaginosus]
MRTIAVIGGGITGLSAAYHLQKNRNAVQEELRIVVIEAAGMLGGKISTHQDGGFLMETGADSIVTRKMNAGGLIEELGLGGEVVYNATGRSYIHVDGELKPIPDDTVFGIPMSLESLAKSTLVSAEGKVEALRDWYTPNETFTKNDTVGSFLEHFLGKELVDKQIAPVLSGVYSGDLADLTIASTLPYLIEYKNEYGSIIRGLSENKAKFKGTGGAKFMSFSGGMSVLIDGLERRLLEGGAEIRKGIRTERLVRDGDRYRLTLADGSELEAHDVILSIPHDAAQALLRDEVLDADFDRFKNSSLISVYMGFDIPDARLPADGTGFIASRHSELVCNACTWTSRKWEHTSAGRQLLVRLFYKSSKPDYERLVRMTEQELLEVALEDMRMSLGLSGQPVAYNVRKWEESMPNYHTRHPAVVKSLVSQTAERYPGLFLAGCSYYGVGIPDCIESGEAAARQILERIGRGAAV